ncbi:EAL domain-containing protein [Rhodoferax sp.]|uniref:EAL domain-containing protein n=1 Tax=Rhodoferax sp. TaxID=50421 RepID=UPI002ACD3ADB|nr:EAL domain-containing protein [Rhodoferax sp.]MDZ7921574.1 EAL domain-containing protein [Rhodoferax sp.]
MHTLISEFSREVLAAGAAVFQVGDTGDSAYVIESGCVEVLVGAAHAQQRVAVLAEGAMFGEVALLDRQARTATVRTLVPTTLVRIDRAHVEELLVRADPVIQYLLRLLLERFRSSSAKSELPPSLPPLSGHAAFAPPEDLHAAAVRTLSLAHDLSDAIDRDQLDLYYQPIVRLPDGTLAGYEALVRWRHPQLGVVQPDEFIPLAEKTGLVHRIGQWVLQRATTDWPVLRSTCAARAGERPFVSVNLSAPELCSPGIVEAVERCLQTTGMDAHELRIELTETVIISSVDRVSASIARLRAMGIGIALDDFGTGYAGLDYLQTLPFTTIKIDRAFVAHMHSSERSFQIIKSALALSQLLGISTVAEGIEDAATGTLLASMGCEYGQGYHYARPRPLHELLPG